MRRPSLGVVLGSSLILAVGALTPADRWPGGTPNGPEARLAVVPTHVYVVAVEVYDDTPEPRKRVAAENFANTLKDVMPNQSYGTAWVAMRDTAAACNRWQSCDLVLVEQFQEGAEHTRFQLTVRAKKRPAHLAIHEPLVRSPRCERGSLPPSTWGAWCRNKQGRPLSRLVRSDLDLNTR